MPEVPPPPMLAWDAAGTEQDGGRSIPRLQSCPFLRRPRPRAPAPLDSPTARKRESRREPPAPVPQTMLACPTSPTAERPGTQLRRSAVGLVRQGRRSRLSARQIGLRSVPWLSWGVLVQAQAQPDVIFSSAETATGPPKRHPRGWRKLNITRRCAWSSRACHAGCSPAPRAPRPGKHPSRQSLAAPPTPARGRR